MGRSPARRSTEAVTPYSSLTPAYLPPTPAKTWHRLWVITDNHHDGRDRLVVDGVAEPVLASVRGRRSRRWVWSFTMAVVFQVIILAAAALAGWLRNPDLSLLWVSLGVFAFSFLTGFVNEPTPASITVSENLLRVGRRGLPIVLTHLTEVSFLSGNVSGATDGQPSLYLQDHHDGRSVFLPLVQANPWLWWHIHDAIRRQAGHVRISAATRRELHLPRSRQRRESDDDVLA